MALRQEELSGLYDDVDLDRDRALIERCQEGDSAAFGNLYARYYERLLRFCLRRLSDRHEAEDATQEAFARAWKALPNFAGERRFYPWLTVIAGNICTDTLRRRSRSTPTENLDLGAFQPVGGGTADATSDEVILAAVDGELVHKALGRLSVRHRHVLDMREGSGWSYQQMADHEGVEIGTIETLLWRARQALKREFNVLAESKGAFAGALIGLGAFMRRGLHRLAQRSAAYVPHGGTGTIRTAMAGVAATSAAVAGVALVMPHAAPAAHSSARAGPPARVAGAATALSPLDRSATAGASTSPGVGGTGPVAGSVATGTAGVGAGAANLNGTGSIAGSIAGSVTGRVAGAGSGMGSSLGSGLGSSVGSVATSGAPLLSGAGSTGKSAVAPVVKGLLGLAQAGASAASAVAASPAGTNPLTGAAPAVPPVLSGLPVLPGLPGLPALSTTVATALSPGATADASTSALPPPASGDLTAPIEGLLGHR